MKYFGLPCHLRSWSWYGPLYGALPQGFNAPLNLAYLVFAVQAFFAISGFVIVASIASRTPRQFIIARMVRLGPVLLLASTMTFIPLYFFSLPPAPPVAFWNYLVSISVLPLSVTGGLDWSLWSLSYELRYYLLIFVLALFFDVPKIAVRVSTCQSTLAPERLGLGREVLDRPAPPC